MSEDREVDARHEMETERQYFEHENFHDDPVEGCWLCERDLAEDHESHERLVPECPLCKDYVAEMSHLYRGVVARRGDDPVYRAEIRNAGRGDLLR